MLFNSAQLEISVKLRVQVCGLSLLLSHVACVGRLLVHTQLLKVALLFGKHAVAHPQCFPARVKRLHLLTCQPELILRHVPSRILKLAKEFIAEQMTPNLAVLFMALKIDGHLRKLLSAVVAVEDVTVEDLSGQFIY